MESKLQKLMCEYFEGHGHEDADVCLVDILPQLKDMRRPTPVEPHQSSWRVVESPRRLMKTYEFVSHKEMSQFVQDLLAFQEDFNHHAKITVDHPNVIIEVYTHDVDDVTELDKEYATAADEILEDARALELKDDLEGYYTEF